MFSPPRTNIQKRKRLRTFCGDAIRRDMNELPDDAFVPASGKLGQLVFSVRPAVLEHGLVAVVSVSNINFFLFQLGLYLPDDCRLPYNTCRGKNF